ncbi:peptidase domain-containing ABC transporter [Synechococcus sp. PCC 7336]|uniref:peptidase domain-containing ABC transporter n=1 Tax=Synechococcus sp. PCC 7336 TaxID=195250 RepID=UPI00034679E3|nr:peptidase domain-containing ABC transporter [Synechococcus sp. PCC 7336]
MTTTFTTESWLAQLAPFNTLPADALAKLGQQVKWVRYRMGQPLVPKDRLPAQLCILSEGQARCIGYEPDTGKPVSLESTSSGELLGWVGVVRDRPCETAIASTECTAAVFPATAFIDLVEQFPTIAAWTNRPTLAEVFDVLGQYLHSRPDSTAILDAQSAANLRELALQVWPQTQMHFLETAAEVQDLDEDYFWFASNGTAAGTLLETEADVARVLGASPDRLRAIGFPASLFLTEATLAQAVANFTPSSTAIAPTISSATIPTVADDIPYASTSFEALPQGDRRRRQQQREQFPFARGRGPIEGPLACFRMLSQYFNLPFRRDVVKRVLVNQQQRTGSISLQACGAIAELVGLKAQLFAAPPAAVGQLPTPALLQWREQLVVLFEANPKELTIAIPERGIQYITLDDFAQSVEGDIEVVALKQTEHTPQQRFGLQWFWPSIVKHRRVLIEVLIASFFVQLFALANPLMVQVIIDKVLVQNSVATLNVLGSLLIVMALFESFLTAIRTNLFADTTNRIDMTLGAQVIDHLLHLPMRYFGRRPVGELSTRVNELENIRQFLTGTALTVVLDAVFSVIYIAVMFLYSWIMALVALSTVPLFALLTFIVAPVIRQQVREKAERNAQTQSYLVESVSGIETVKAQNIELSARWQWQQKYARYVSAGFKKTITSSAASSIQNFLNKLSGLMLLWVGAYLVLQGQLTLGQLIAFRIIAGYVTQPLLRLLSLWQNFQETALSLERLSDILDTPQEVEGDDRNHIPMPPIAGRVTYENISFRFKDNGPLQLKAVNLSFEAGQFVGIVGQSGSGKSTLMKLLMRLYRPLEGRITIDRYDIHKVELYSLRRQIGMVLQDSLLFDGTVQENIALTNPDAPVEEIIGAAKVAVAHEFIMELPQGYNTRVGERGSSLSGGQRQRIAIARVILQNPNLLILDEATSALDYDSERKVCTNLQRTFRDRTVFFITHRLSTIRQADIIIMMDSGMVAEQGTHDELMELQGRYYALYQQQEVME